MTPRSAVRKLATLVGIFLGLVAIALLLAEWVLKWSGAQGIVFSNALRPYVMFGPVPNYTWRSDRPSPTSRSGEYAVSYTNADGFRIESPEHVITKIKPAGQLRIAMLGGSTVHIGSRFDVTLPGALRRELRARFKGRDIEVINAGIISAISRQELVLLVTTVLDYQPDIVITYDGINDTGQMLYFESRPNHPYLYGALERLWTGYVADQQASIWSLLANRSAVARALWPQRFRPPPVLNPIPAQELIDNRELRLTYSKAHQENWRRIARICSTYGIEPIFILQPTSLYGVFPQRRRDAGQSAQLFANYLIYEDFRAGIRELAADESGARVLDMAATFPDPGLYHDGAHVYDEVNDLIAKKIAEFIEPVVQARGRP